ncbi:3-dehydroquinate synthase [Nocardioides sp.]|uniref:3-dehydroquinate synthase n=1 Tax=Nocardioides sp. TaxID=35761 RepID=UPI002B26B6DA|nr:3-dehydroquinate synthase [Nocardioides sp.]
MSAVEIVQIDLADRRYAIHVGAGLLNRAGDALADLVSGRKVAVVADETVAALHLPALIQSLRGVASVVHTLTVPSGESAKSMDGVADLLDRLLALGIDRRTVVIALGGGVTGDLAGFAAAIALRGLDFIQIPTTLLAQVDSSVGGKTGVNTAAGKNLVGSFHEPAGVLCDLSLLETLPRDELVAGLGEVVKCGFIADPEILRLVETTDPETLVASSPVLRELVERAIRVKIDVVVADLKEAGGSELTGAHPGREALNYGHTLAHAIERAEDYEIRHGEAVAIGCVFVAELAHRASGLSAEIVERHREAFSRVGLPTSYEGAGFEELLATMRLDKKSRGNQLRFVVLSDVGVPTVLAGPSEDDLRAAFVAMSEG